MTKLVWDETGKRIFETGIDRGVLYVMDANGAYPAGIAWNGLVSVSEAPSGAEASPFYADNIKYINLMSAEEFGATIEAFTYPEEFEQCDGSLEAGSTGALIGQQARKQFGLCYRTRVGNDVDGDSHGYKLHLIYGCLASPSEKAFQTVNDSPEAITFSWTIATTPVAVANFRPTSYVVVDSLRADPAKLTAFEDIIYGVTTPVPIVSRLPLPAEVITLLT